MCNVRFKVTNADKYVDLTNILDDAKIDYTVIDRDNCIVGFDVAKKDLEDFQQNMAGNVIGSQVPGYFEMTE